MARFFNNAPSSVVFKAPTEGLGPTPPSVRPVQQSEPKKEKKEEKEPDRDKQAEEPIRKSEAGRYDGADGYQDLGGSN